MAKTSTSSPSIHEAGPIRALLEIGMSKESKKSAAPTAGRNSNRRPTPRAPVMREGGVQALVGSEGASIIAVPEGAEAIAIVDASELAALHDEIASLRSEIARLEAEAGMLPGEVVLAIVRDENPLRVWREYRGLKASALAEASGTSRGYISELEADASRLPKVGAGLLASLADALDCTIEDLLPPAD